MPDFVKHSNGEMDWSKLFMGLAMAVVLIIQQFQTYHLADLKAQAAIQEKLFMPKDRVLRKENEALAKLKLALDKLDAIEKRLDKIEGK